MNRFPKLIIVAAAKLLFISALNQNIQAQNVDRPITTIPFALTPSNNIVVNAVLNGTDPLKLMFHTGAADVSLTEDAVRKLKSITFSGSVKAKAWGGEGNSRFSQGNSVKIGKLHRKKISVWEDKNSGKDTDGKFGFDFFQHPIVEIDFDQHRIALYDKLPRKAGKYERLNIENDNGNLLIQGNCVIEEKTYSNKFMIHSGYAGGILLDDAFAASAGVDSKIKIIEESSLKDSFGNTVKVKKGILPIFMLGSAKLADVPTGFFAGAIGARKMSVLGCEILWKFNLIFDIDNHSLYLSPRHT